MNHRQKPSRLTLEWKAFKRAFMKSPEFNPLGWIYRLVAAAVHDAVEWSGLQWRRIVPAFALTLIVFLAMSYAFILRTKVIQPRWCDIEKDRASTNGPCSWVYLHDVAISYLIGMILFFFIKASTTSPGVLVTTNQADMVVDSSSSSLFYSLDLDAEGQRVLSYGRLETAPMDAPRMPSEFSNGPMASRSNDVVQFHPSPYASHCKKCDLIRPPRCHHCRICNRCVLQYDHHCVWLNNCVGYNNVRLFVLTLVYTTAACWYGVLLLYKPFYGPLQDSLRQYGGLLGYAQHYLAHNFARDEKGLFTMPSLSEIQSSVWTPQGTISPQAVVDLVFPLVLSVGAILAIFLGTHVKYILSALTTLEYRIKLDRQYNSLMSKSSLTKPSSDVTMETWTNPFDRQSPRRNWNQIMGNDWWYCLLPLVVHPLPPFLPKNLSSKQEAPSAST